MKKLRWLVFLLMACALLLQAASPDPSPAVSVITREALQDRLSELQRLRERALANVNAISGAIQECEYWLEKLKEDKKKEKKEEELPN